MENALRDESESEEVPDYSSSGNENQPEAGLRAMQNRLARQNEKVTVNLKLLSISGRLPSLGQPEPGQAGPATLSIFVRFPPDSPKCSF